AVVASASAHTDISASAQSARIAFVLRSCVCVCVRVEDFTDDLMVAFLSCCPGAAREGSGTRGFRVRQRKGGRFWPGARCAAGPIALPNAARKRVAAAALERFDALPIEVETLSPAPQTLPDGGAAGSGEESRRAGPTGLMPRKPAYIKINGTQ